MTAGFKPVRLKTRAVPWLLLIALAWVQIATAAHHCDHSSEASFDGHSDEFVESCTVCAMLDRDEPVVEVFIRLPGTVAPSVKDSAQQESLKPIEGFALYSARASP